MYVALSDDLIKEFLAYKSNSFNQDIIAKLFKYLHPFKIGKHQQHLFQPEILKQLVANPVFVHSSSATTEIDLIKDTRFKIMLTKDRNVYPYINILDDEIDVNFNAFYKATDDRSKAISHIKALLADANNIEIIDKYLFKSTKWNDNLNLLKQILPTKRVKITFKSEQIDSSKKIDVESCCTAWMITYLSFDATIHDRYIKTDKVTILLSSGIDYLHDKSKDLTYLVRSN